MNRHVIAVLLGVDIVINAVGGGRKYQTISSRIGESLKRGTWATKLNLPDWFKQHCLASVKNVLV